MEGSGIGSPPPPPVEDEEQQQVLLKSEPDPADRVSRLCPRASAWVSECCVLFSKFVLFIKEEANGGGRSFRYSPPRSFMSPPVRNSYRCSLGDLGGLGHQLHLGPLARRDRVGGPAAKSERPAVALGEMPFEDAQTLQTTEQSPG